MRNFAVGTVYSKTETVFVALFATFIAREPLGFGAWVGILVCLGGVAILSVRGSFSDVRGVLADLTHKGARLRHPLGRDLRHRRRHHPRSLEACPTATSWCAASPCWPA